MSLSLLVAPLLVSAAPIAGEAPFVDAPPPLPVPVLVQMAPPVAVTAVPPTPTDAAAPPVSGPDIVVTGRTPSPADPVEQLNEVSYEVVQAVDQALIGPVARTYKRGVPRPIQDGLHNVLNNLDEPIVFINFLLQLKPGKAIETLGRFAINSTVGVGGLLDIAKRKPFNLPRRSNGLADTLGYYGVGPGPYLFLPIIGSTTVRDLVARPFDLLVLPAIAPRPFANPGVNLAKGVLSSLDERAENDEKLDRLHSSRDPYKAQREEYLARRRAEIDVLKGKRQSIYDPPYYELPPPADADEDQSQQPQAAPEAPQP